MKFLLLIIFSIFILLAKVPTPDRCDLVTAKNALPVRIFAETTIDGRDQPVLLTRFFHNKAGILAHELGRCYFNFFDLNQVVASASLFGLLPWLYFFYRLATTVSKYPVILGVFMIPALLIFVSVTQVAYMHKVFAIIGLVIWYMRKK